MSADILHETIKHQFADFIAGEETDIAASILSSKINELCQNSSDKTFDNGLSRTFNKLNQHTLNLNEI